MYEYVIGLEVHLKLSTRTKIFCGCLNQQDFDDLLPNSHICPTCCGHPGGLPVLQRESLDKALMLAKSLNASVEKNVSFDRKSYFYPDLPMGYQITQFYHPIISQGELLYFLNDFRNEKTVRIKEAHLEIDTGKIIHIGNQSLVDYNRSGTPLIEIVTEPDFCSDEEVIAFLKELQRLVRFHGIGYADLEKGQMRCDVNISVKKTATDTLGTRVEIKNVNSFSSIKKAILYEFNRQVGLIDSGKNIEQETVGRDDLNNKTFLMRSKADVVDYRYFPEPDLPGYNLSEDEISFSSSKISVNPSMLIQKYRDEYKFNKEFIYGLISDVDINRLFEEGVKKQYDPKLIAKRLVGPIAGYLNEHQLSLSALSFSSEQYFDFLTLITEKNISDNNAKIVMKTMLENGGDPSTIIHNLGLENVDIDISLLCDQVILDHEKVVVEYRSGKLTAIGFLVGQVMKKSGGTANPVEVKSVLEKKISD